MCAHALIRFVDKYILGPVCWIRGIFAKKNSIIPPKKILVLKLWALGDSVNALPAIKTLHDKIPGVKIDVMARENNYKVFEGQGFIDKVILFESYNMKDVRSLKKSYDLAIDLEPFLNISALLARRCARQVIGFSGGSRSLLYDASIKFRPDRHIVKTYFDMINLIGIKAESLGLEKLSYTKLSLKKVSRLIKDIEKPIIGFCPSVGNEVKEREWPKERYKELAKKLESHIKKCAILLIGTKDDKEICRFIKDDDIRMKDLSGELSKEELFCLLEKIDLFISNDTGPMHVAAAQGAPTIGLFGPNTPKIWAPYGKDRNGCDNISIFHPRKGCPFLNNTSHYLVPNKLTESQKRCMEGISVKEVYDAALKKLEHKKK